MNTLPRIAILRFEKLPSFVTWDIPNLDELFEEDKLLIRGFESQGFQTSHVIWTDTDIDWNQFDIALIRSTWDYVDKPELFLKVLSNINSSSCRLFNPFEAVRWNMDKHYLPELEKLGIPIIPTYPLSGKDIDTIYKLFNENKWYDVILKPAIGLGASDSYRITLDELDSKIKKLSINKSGSEYLVQPFIEDVISEGEWSFIYFNKQLSHVLLKKPAPGDYRVQEIYGGTLQPAQPLPRDLKLAEEVILKLPYDVLYARLDFVRVNGQLSIMEVELIEPVFSFNLVPEAVMRLVEAVKGVVE